MNVRRRSGRAGRTGDTRVFNDGPDVRRRGLWLVLAFLSMATAVFGRLVQIQVIQGKSLAAQAAQTHTTSVTLQATRGEILDRDGRVLVSDVQVFDVFADPALISPSDRNAVAGMLAPILQVGTPSSKRCSRTTNSTTSPRASLRTSTRSSRHCA